MRKRCLYLTVLFLILVVSSAYSADKMRIVVMNLKADGVSSRTARTVSNMLRTEFINLRKFTIVERAQMDAILNEQGLQQSGCTDQECAVQMGRLMSAKKIMVGEVSPMGKSIIVTVRIVDVEKGISEFAATQKAKSEDVLDTSVAKIARKIARRIGGKGGVPGPMAEPEGPSVTTPAGYYLWSALPGGGQFYAGRTAKGIIFGSLGLLSAAFAAYAYMDYSGKKKDYEDLSVQNNYSNVPTESVLMVYNNNMQTYDSAFQDYDDAAGMTKMALMVFGGIYIIHWIDVLFFSKPVFDMQANAVDNRENYISFDFNCFSRDLRGRMVNAAYNMRF